jgi:hypothetical protein
MLRRPATRIELTIEEATLELEQASKKQQTKVSVKTEKSKEQRLGLMQSDKYQHH